MANTLSSEVKAIILASLMDDKTLQLQRELDRQTYESVDKVLKICGGKWNKSKGLHVFERGTETLKIALASDTLPPKNPLAFFPTPQELAEMVVSFARPEEGERILEPSAGHGVFCKIMRDDYDIKTEQMDIIEFDPFNCQHLREEGFEPHQTDFLEWNPGYQYDCVVMNPPFSAKGDPIAHVTHFLHAYDMWNGNGNMVAVLPPSNILSQNSYTGLARERSKNPKILRYQEIIESYGHVHDNPSKSFRPSGTDVETVTVLLPCG